MALAPAIARFVMTQTFDVEFTLSEGRECLARKTAVVPHQPDRPWKCGRPKSAKDGCILARLFSVHSPINGILAPTFAILGLRAERDVKS
jgi:hypothetical protein